MNYNLDSDVAQNGSQQICIYVCKRLLTLSFIVLEILYICVLQFKDIWSVRFFFLFLMFLKEISPRFPDEKYEEKQFVK